MSVLERVAAIAERERAKAEARRADMRAQYPEFAAFVDDLRKHFGEPHAIVLNGKRYGREPLPFRRNQLHQPPIPGL